MMRGYPWPPASAKGRRIDKPLPRNSMRRFGRQMLRTLEPIATLLKTVQKIVDIGKEVQDAQRL